MFKIAKQMRKEKDVDGSKYVRDENGTLKMKEEEVLERWKGYFSSLLNEKTKHYLEEEDGVEGPIWREHESRHLGRHMGSQATL